MTQNSKFFGAVIAAACCASLVFVDNIFRFGDAIDHYQKAWEGSKKVRFLKLYALKHYRTL